MTSDHDRSEDGVSRRNVLECVTWARTGVLWTLSGGVPRFRQANNASHPGVGSDNQGGQRIRYVTLAAATLAAIAFAGAAYADSYCGPTKNGNQCWHRQDGNSLGYWSPCPSAAAESPRNRSIAAGKKTEEANREAARTEARGAQATRINASSAANNNTPRRAWATPRRQPSLPAQDARTGRLEWTQCESLSAWTVCPFDLYD